jgi:hypothetical protein
LPRPRHKKSFELKLETLRKRARRRQWSASAAALARAAERQGLPCETLGDGYLLFGQGVEQQVVYVPSTVADHARRDASRPVPPVDGRSPDAPLELPPGARIPVAVIAGSRGTSSIAADLEGLLRAAGEAVGLAAPKRTAVCGEPLPYRSAQRRDAARFLLHDPRVGMLVTTTSPLRVVRRGLRIDRCSVAAVADAAPHRDGESFRRGLEVVMKATSGFVIVDAANGAAVEAARMLDTERVVLCAPREDDALREHAARGGRVVVRGARDGGERIELRRGDEILVSAPVAAMRPGRRLGRRLRARMFALALAFGLGLSPQQIAAAVERRRYLHP